MKGRNIDEKIFILDCNSRSYPWLWANYWKKLEIVSHLTPIVKSRKQGVHVHLLPGPLNSAFHTTGPNPNWVRLSYPVFRLCLPTSIYVIKNSKFFLLWVNLIYTMPQGGVGSTWSTWCFIDLHDALKILLYVGKTNHQTWSQHQFRIQVYWISKDLINFFSSLYDHAWKGS